MADITGTYPSSGELQGVISTASFIAGEVVGMRGPKGDKGDKGDTGDTGPQGAKGDTGATGAKGDTGDKGDKGDKGDTGNDGYSPSASVSKVGNKATITITDKDGTTTADIYDGTGSGTVTDVTQNGTSVLDGSVAKVTVPTKVSDLTNDSGFITDYTETDPTVPAWAKQSTKPSYSYSEISGTPTLADVATSGDYDDLINTPNVATVVELTQAQYDALTPAEKNNGTVYCVSDASGTYLTASEVSYGSSSVQSALDEIDDEIHNGASGYSKLPDGTLICHGVVDFPPAEVGRQSVIVTFPSNFKQGTYPHVVVSWRDNSTQLRNYFDDWIIIDAAGSGYNQATFVANRKIATWDWIAHYIAIGRWK